MTAAESGAAEAEAARRKETEADAAKPPAAKPSAAASASPAPSSVHADVAELLRTLSLSAHGPALCATLGVSSVADLHHVSDAMLRDELPAMRPVERAKLLAAVAPAPPAAAPASAAAPAGCCDVMISYRVPETGDGGDKSVFALQAALQKRGYRVFVGEAAIEGGASWPTTIQKGVEDCKAFVILCSPSYGDEAVSPWTKRELVLADNLRKPLIPVWHSGPYPPRQVAIYLGEKQRIPNGNFSNGYVKAKISTERVAEEVAAALARAGVPTSGAQ